MAPAKRRRYVWGATLSPGVDVGTMSADASVEIEGTFHVNVDAKTDLLALPSSHAVVLGSGSALTISALEPLGSVGHHRVVIATAGFIS